MSSTDQFILFAIACFAIGTWWRMATKGMTFGEALKDCGKTAAAPTKALIKTGRVVHKNRRRFW